MAATPDAAVAVAPANHAILASRTLRLHRDRLPSPNLQQSYLIVTPAFVKDRIRTPLRSQKNNQWHRTRDPGTTPPPP